MSKILFYNNIERINWQVKKTVYNNRYSLDPKIISKITSFDPSYLVKEKVYLDRGESCKLENNYNIYKYRDHQIIVNEKEIKSFLISQGFDIIKPYEFNFLDQVNIFSRLKFIISLCGSGLANICFCKKKTKILEIKSIKSGNEWQNLSKLSGLNYHQIRIKPIIKSGIPQNGLLFCDLSKIKKAIHLLEKKQE